MADVRYPGNSKDRVRVAVRECRGAKSGRAPESRGPPTAPSLRALPHSPLTFPHDYSTFLTYSSTGASIRPAPLYLPATHSWVLVGVALSSRASFHPSGRVRSGRPRAPPRRRAFLLVWPCLPRLPQQEEGGTVRRSLQYHAK
ncbi:hypothetical protein O3P69_020152 [Scylla paramamosain]|uniref:Uncharacterized protein n=1 Tax=Scylla paramamosain TaxID=85552 RepID=A0AAW0TK25_SCYPA